MEQRAPWRRMQGSIQRHVVRTPPALPATSPAARLVQRQVLLLGQDLVAQLQLQEGREQDEGRDP